MTRTIPRLRKYAPAVRNANAPVFSARLSRDVRVYRLGKIEIQCYIVGLDGEGNLAGLKTVAIET